MDKFNSSTFLHFGEHHFSFRNILSDSFKYLLTIYTKVITIYSQTKGVSSLKKMIILSTVQGVGILQKKVMWQKIICDHEEKICIGSMDTSNNRHHEYCLYIHIPLHALVAGF